VILCFGKPSKFGHKTRFDYRICCFQNVKTTDSKEKTTKNQKNKEKTY
jgi:hypothetical protein